MTESNAFQTLVALASAAQQEKERCDEGVRDARESLADHVADIPQEILWLYSDMRDARDERVPLNNRIHDLKREVSDLRAKYEQLLHWMDVDPEDEKAVRQATEDAKSLKRFKSRQAGGRLRSGEDHSPDTLAHYEQKLADKRSRIRQLEVVVKRLRQELAGIPDQALDGDESVGVRVATPQESRHD